MVGISRNYVFEVCKELEIECIEKNIETNEYLELKIQAVNSLRNIIKQYNEETGDTIEFKNSVKFAYQECLRDFIERCDNNEIVSYIQKSNLPEGIPELPKYCSFKPAKGNRG